MVLDSKSEGMVCGAPKTLVYHALPEEREMMMEPVLLNDRMVFGYDEHGAYEPNHTGNPLKYRLYDTTDFEDRRGTPAQTCTHAISPSCSAGTDNVKNWQEVRFSDNSSHYVEAIRIWLRNSYDGAKVIL